MIVVTVIATILCAISYRAGGMSKEEAKIKLPWVPLFLVKGRTRDIVCVLVVMLWVYLFLPQVKGILYLYSSILMFFAMTTYWDRWPPNKGRDNFFMHGLFIGLSLLPIAYGSGMWAEVIIRAVVLGFLMRVWCSVFSNVDMEEYFRGGIIGATLPLLLFTP